MAFPSADRGGSSDLISVDTHALKTAAPAFRQAGQQVETLLQSLTGSVQSANGDLFLLLEFAKMASIMEHLQQRIGVAMQCAAGGLNRIGTTLEIVSDLYVETETTFSHALTQIEDDLTPLKRAALLPPMPRLSGRPGSSPQSAPTPESTPGSHTPLQPSLNPQPATQPPLLPGLLPTE